MITTLVQIGPGPRMKSAIERKPSSLLKFTGYVEVHVNFCQLANYTKLQLSPKLRADPSKGELVMCGGKFRQPLFWIGEEETPAGSGKALLGPSCGRVFHPVAGVLRSRGANIFCEDCAQVCNCTTVLSYDPRDWPERAL